MLTLLINESNPLDGLFANSTTGGVGTVPDISVADAGQAVSVQSFTRAGGIITDSFVAGDALHIGIGDGVNAPVCYVALSSASPAVGTMPINTAGMVALFAATVANQLSLTLAVVRTRGAYTNTIFSAPIVIRRSAINISTAVPTPSILGTGVAAALQVAINTALGFVRLDASARLPAVDGSQLTNLPNTGGVTSITGTANEITVTGTTTPTLSLPSALTFTGKTVTGGTFASPTLTTPTIGDGTEAAPSLSFTSDTNTGVYRPATDTVGIVGGGNDVVRMTGIASATDYLEIKNGIGVGSPLHVLAEGASANIGVHLQPKGSGLFTISDGTDFAKGIRFRSSSSAASAITLLDAVSTAGRVITLPDATGTLALVSGDLGTPSALVGTNITGTASININGTVGATTPSTVAGTTGVFIGDLNTTGSGACIYTNGANAEIYTNGADANIYTNGVNAQISTNGANGYIYTNGVGAHIYTAGQYANIYTTGANAYIESRSTFKLNGGTFKTTLSHAATADRAIAFPDAAGTLLLADGSGAALTTLNASNVSSGTLDAARMANAGVHTGDATGTFPAITLNAAQTGITSVGTLTGGATGAGFTVALDTSTITGTLADARLSANVPLKDAANTFTAENINSKSGAASVTAMKFSGVPFAGTGTTSFPLVYINDANATASTTLNTAGTYFGVNGDGTQDLMNLMKDGVSQVKVSSTGAVNLAGTLSVTGFVTLYGSYLTTSSVTPLYLNSLIVMNSNKVVGFSSTSNNTADALIGRNAAGILQIGTTTNNALGSLLLTNLTASGTLAVTGATTLTGNLTSNGALISTPQALTGAGAVNVTTLTTAVTTTAPAQALTLADGTNGQIKTIVHQALSGGGTWVLTPTTKTGYTTITSIAVGETCTLQFFTTIGWCILSLRGAIAA